MDALSGSKEKKGCLEGFFNRCIPIVTTSGADFQSVIDGEMH
jgi:hypothetical protein